MELPFELFSMKLCLTLLSHNIWTNFSVIYYVRYPNEMYWNKVIFPKFNDIATVYWILFALLGKMIRLNNHWCKVLRHLKESDWKTYSVQDKNLDSKIQLIISCLTPGNPASKLHILFAGWLFAAWTSAVIQLGSLSNLC